MQNNSHKSQGIKILKIENFHTKKIVYLVATSLTLLWIAKKGKKKKNTY